MPNKLSIFLFASFFLFTINASAQAVTPESSSTTRVNAYQTRTRTANSSTSNRASETRPSIVTSNLKEMLEVINLPGKIHQAFVTDGSGNAVMQLSTSTARWSLSSENLRSGLYAVIIHSGSQWFTLRFDYNP